MSDSNESNSDEEVPVAHLCCLPSADLHTLNPHYITDFSTLLTILASENCENAFAAVIQIRMLIVRKRNQSIQAVIDAGGVDILYKAMQYEDCTIRLEATWAVSDLLLGTSKTTTKVLTKGFISTLVRLMNLENWEVKKEVLRAFGNIAADSALWRDQILKAGGLTAILANLYEDSHTYMENVCWVVSNIMKAIPPPDPCYQIQAVPFILSHLSLENDSEMNSDLLWALISIAELNVVKIELMETHCILLVSLLENPAVTYPALVSICYFIYYTATYTTVFLDCGLLSRLDNLLRHSDQDTRREACWVLSSISLESSYTEAVILSGVLPQVIVLALEVPIQQLSIQTLASVCSHCSPGLKLHVLTLGIARPLTEDLSLANSETKAIAIAGLRGLLKDAKAAISIEVIRSYVSVGEIVDSCRELSRQGVAGAKELLEEIDWLVYRDT